MRGQREEEKKTVTRKVGKCLKRQGEIFLAGKFFFFFFFFSSLAQSLTAPHFFESSHQLESYFIAKKILAAFLLDTETGKQRNNTNRNK